MEAAGKKLLSNVSPQHKAGQAILILKKYYISYDYRTFSDLKIATLHLCKDNKHTEVRRNRLAFSVPAGLYI